MEYPGRVIKLGETDARVLTAVKAALNRRLAPAEAEPPLDAAEPGFDPDTKQAVKLFQARNMDSEGRPLVIDGEIGALTWAALFGDRCVPRADTPPDALLAAVIEVALGEARKEVRETPKNSNRGPEVDEYLRRVGVGVGLAWCGAFVYWCFDEAARSLGRDNPMFKTAGCLAHWRGAPSKGASRLAAKQAVADPARVRPGMVFIMDFGKGLGHTGIVETVEGGLIHTVEGNTDASKTREGGGVYRLSRKIVSINKGFIDYAGS